MNINDILKEVEFKAGINPSGPGAQTGATEPLSNFIASSSAALEQFVDTLNTDPLFFPNGDGDISTGNISTNMTLIGIAGVVCKHLSSCTFDDE